MNALTSGSLMDLRVASVYLWQLRSDYSVRVRGAESTAPVDGAMKSHRQMKY